jgi:sugar phosphate isomerase/epimerase
MAASLPRTPLRQLVPAAAAAGFAALTLWPNTWRHALRRDGLTLAGMRDLVDAHRVAVAGVVAVDDWRPAAAGGLPSTGRAEAIEVALALGAPTIATAHAVGGKLDVDRDAAAFGQLCDCAAVNGLRVALEFVPFTAIPDLSTALSFLRRVDRSNAGLVVDLWHLARSGSPPAELRDVPPELIFSVQLADGPAMPPTDIVDEAMYHRQLPGTGQMVLAEGVASLPALGGNVPIGPEVFSAESDERPGDWARELFASTYRLLELAEAG